MGILQMSSAKKSSKANAKAGESASEINHSSTDLLQVAVSVQKQSSVLKKDDDNSLFSRLWKNKETYLSVEDARKQLEEQKTFHKAAVQKKKDLDDAISKTTTLKDTTHLLLPRLQINVETADVAREEAKEKYKAEEDNKGYNAADLSVEQLENERLAHNTRLRPFKQTYDDAKLAAEKAAKVLADKKTEIKSLEEEIKRLCLFLKETKGEIEIYADQMQEKKKVEAIAKLSDVANAWMHARDEEQKQKRKFYTEAMGVAAEYDLAQLLEGTTEHSDSKKLKH